MSPIIGLTDGTPAMKEIGRIRKGGAKPNAYQPGPNLDHFRVTFRAGEDDSAKRFKELYGDKPTLINARLAFDNVDENWWAFYTCYLKGGMLGQANGKHWIYLRDYKTQDVLIRNGELTEKGETRNISLVFDKKEPVYFYYSKRQKKDMPVFAKPEGRLDLVLPELGRFVYLKLLTHGLNDLANISGFLADLERKAKRLGIYLSDIPLIISRELDAISKPMTNGRGMVDEWLVKIEVHPDFADLALRFINRATVQALSALPPAVEDAPLLSPPEGDYEDPNGDDMGDIKPGNLFEPALPETVDLTPEPDTESEPTNGKRPFPPEVVKEKLLAAYEKYTKEGWTPQDRGEEDEKTLRGIVRANLENCFAGDKNSTEKRHTVTFDLWGKESTNDLDLIQLVVTKRWLDAKPDDGGEWHSNHNSAFEAKDIYKAALKAEGQTEMDLEAVPE